MSTLVHQDLTAANPLIITKSDFDTLPNQIIVSDPDLEKLVRDGWSCEFSERTLDFRSHWDQWMGFREFVQNSLDAASEFSLEYSEKDNISYVLDNGPGFPPQALLLGSEKAKTQQDLHRLRGVYGEGMKVAFQPFLILEKKIIIRTKGFDYTYLAYPYKDTQVPCLLRLSRPNQITSGTCVAIQNFDARPFFTNFIQSLDSKEIILTQKGGPRPFDDFKRRQVLNRPGDIYFRDIFVINVNDDELRGNDCLLFGYNLWFDSTVKFLGPDRNRFNPDSDALNREMFYIVKTFAEPEAREFLEELFRRAKLAIDCGVSEYSIFEFRWFSYFFRDLRCRIDSEELKNFIETSLKAIHQAILAVFKVKEYSAASLYDAHNRVQRKILEHLGIPDLTKYLPEGLIDSLSHFKLVKTARQWQELSELKEVEEITVDKFREMAQQTVSKKEAEVAGSVYRALTYQLQRLAQKETANYKVKFFGREQESLLATEVDLVGGFCDYRNQTIWIKINNLQNHDALLDVFIHELAHARSGRSDLTDEFEKALVTTARKVSVSCLPRVLPKKISLLQQKNLIQEISKNCNQGETKAVNPIKFDAFLLEAIALYLPLCSKIKQYEKETGSQWDPSLKKYVPKPLPENPTVFEKKDFDNIPRILSLIFDLPLGEMPPISDLSKEKYVFSLGELTFSPDARHYQRLILKPFSNFSWISPIWSNFQSKAYYN